MQPTELLCAIPYESTFSVATRTIYFRQKSLRLAMNIQNGLIFTNQGFQRDIQLTNRNVAALCKESDQQKWNKS